MKYLIIFLLLISSLLTPLHVLAAESPLVRPNNKVGIHILFTTELNEAAKLINNKGDWGYVIIPIQAGDKDLKKWQDFLDQAGKLHVIPIIRLATEGDYFNTSVWRKPSSVDVLDFANFLNSLTWPTQNRYIVVFNEVNRGDEWGGEANPSEYAQILSYATTAFKSLSTDFYIIGGGFDNAAPNQGTKYIDQYRFMREMNQAVPGVFNQIDGFASHSYPNPGFSQPPEVKTSESIASFTYERTLLNELSDKELPIFITETGWDGDVVSDEQRANYYITAFASVWNDPDVAAVTPFLFNASGQFEKFSFLNSAGKATKQYDFIKDMDKVKGKPLLKQQVLGEKVEPTMSFVKKTFKDVKVKEPDPILNTILGSIYTWALKL